MNEKESLVKSLKQVIITGKTYTEYIEALADHLLTNYDLTRKNKGGGKIEYRAEQSKTNANRCVACGAFISEGLELCFSCSRAAREYSKIHKH